MESKLKNKDIGLNLNDFNSTVNEINSGDKFLDLKKSRIDLYMIFVKMSNIDEFLEYIKVNDVSIFLPDDYFFTVFHAFLQSMSYSEFK